MDVVQGGAPAPAINIVCPHYLNGVQPQEQHIIYSVQVQLDPKKMIQCGFLSDTENLFQVFLRSFCRAALLNVLWRNIFKKYFT